MIYIKKTILVLLTTLTLFITSAGPLFAATTMTNGGINTTNNPTIDATGLPVVGPSQNNPYLNILSATPTAATVVNQDLSSTNKNCDFITNSGYYCMLTGDIPVLGTESGRLQLSGGLKSFFQKLYRVGITVAVGLSILMITFGGFRMATTDSVTNKEEGKEMINAAVIGLLIALFSYVILYTVNPELVNPSTDALNLSTTPLNQK